MRQFIPKVLLCASIVAGGIRIASAQEGALYQPAKAAGSAALKAAYGSCRLVQQDIPALLSHVQAGYAAQRGGAARPMQITVPFPDGRDVKFTVRDAEILSPGLAAENPDLHAMKGVSEDGRYRIRLTTSPMGMMGLVQGEGEAFYLTPRDNRNPEVLLVYNAKEAKAPGLQCGVADLEHQVIDATHPLGKTTHGDASIRTYRMAVACTGEYTAWAGGTQAAALTQITATFNGVTDIYEQELGIHFTLVCPTTIRFTNAGTDPYSVGDVSSTTLAENQTTLNSTTYLGSANYDLGMVLTAKSSGGLASKPSACSSSFKARSASGLDPATFPTGPSGLGFIVTVAHETGHQFDASHSFAANTGNCNGNTSASTGWEPGGGSTIMAYAGTCTGLAYQDNSDPYFHTGNLLQMSAYMVSGNGNTCGTTTANSNAAPTATVPGGTAFTIPVSTPFRLRATTTQIESNTLTYAFDQYDAVGGTGTNAAPASTNTTGPMFRPFPAGTNNTQYFPSLAALVGINPATYEVLPSVARTLNFRYTVRDNVAYTANTAGRTADGAVTVTTVACATPFAVTSQTSSGTSVANGTNTMTVTWNTATSCATCSTVNIRFSRDGGRSFPYVLQASTANDGSATVPVPNLPTDRGRILVECVDNIHFNINTAAQTITSSCAAEGTSFAPTNDLYTSVAGSASLNQTLTPLYGSGITTPLSGTITTANDSGSLTIFNGGNCTTYGNTTRYVVLQFTPGTTASYTFTRTAGSNLVINLYDSSVNLNAQCNNLIAGDFTTVTATLSKNKVYSLLLAYYGTSYPASYAISVNGGTIYTAVPNPGAGFNYSYVIVANGTGLIKAIQSTGNMSNSATYPAGNYTIWGLSSSSTAAALNTTYAGTSFAAFRTAVQNQTGGLCAVLSSNARRIGIATPTPTVLLSFDGRLTGRRSALLFWEAGSEEATRAFDVERSYDGKTFEYAGRVMPSRALGGAYSLTDAGISQTAEAVYYRLKISELSGEAKYSGVVRLKLEAIGSAVSFTVSPNPVQQGMLRASVSTGTGGRYDIAVVDVAGRRLIGQSVELQAGENTVTVPVSMLAPGLYMVELRGESTSTTQRFVKP